MAHVLEVRAAAGVVRARAQRESEREDAVVDVDVSPRVRRVILEDRHLRGVTEPSAFVLMACMHTGRGSFELARRELTTSDMIPRHELE